MIIDMHGHWLSSGLKEWGWQLLALRNASEHDMPLGGIEKENERNLRCMDERGIDLQILSIRPVSMLSHEPPSINIPWSKVFNNVLAEAISRNPDRFRGMATLPQSDMEASIEELERSVKQLGMVGAIVNPNPTGDDSSAPLDDAYWFPLYEKAIELDVPLYIHASFLRTARYLRHRSAYMIGHPVEETIAGPTLVYGGILEKYPDLKIIIAHGGGATPYQIGRYLTPPSQGSLSKSESNLYGTDYSGSFIDGFKKLYFDSTLYTKEALELLIKVVGPERVLFGTETPGRGTFEYEGRQLDDLIPLIDSIDWINDEQRKMIYEDNARKLYRI